MAEIFFGGSAEFIQKAALAGGKTPAQAKRLERRIRKSEDLYNKTFDEAGIGRPALSVHIEIFPEGRSAGSLPLTDADMVPFDALTRQNYFGFPLEGFTRSAYDSLKLAAKTADSFEHYYIGTEHLLLGLVKNPNSLANNVLANLGVETEKVKSAVEFIIGKGAMDSAQPISLTPRGQKVLDLAVAESKYLNAGNHIGTHHLLGGIIREGEGIGFGVLESLGVSLPRVRTESARIIANMATQTSPQTS